MKDKLGLVHIYCGDGKGKTTAATGLAIRALGQGFKVVFVQFLKNGRSNEIGILEQFDGLKYFANKKMPTFSFKMNEQQKKESLEAHVEIFKEAVALCEKGNCDVLILDEIIGTLASALFDEDLLLDWLKNRPSNIEVILTGRNPSSRLLEQADYISEIKKIRHPYDKGIAARFGIEK